MTDQAIRVFRIKEGISRNEALEWIKNIAESFDGRDYSFGLYVTDKVLYENGFVVKLGYEVVGDVESADICNLSMFYS